MTIKIEGIERAIRKFLRVAELPRTKKAVRKAGELVQARLREYPPERHGPQIFSADPAKRLRQLRAIFALRKAGRIPYQRTRRLARGWKFDYRSMSDDMTATVSNEVPYAHWVQSDARQTMYHKLTGWKTAGEILRSEETRAINVVFQSIEETVKED